MKKGACYVQNPFDREYQSIHLFLECKCSQSYLGLSGSTSHFGNNPFPLIVVSIALPYLPATSMNLLTVFYTCCSNSSRLPVTDRGWRG